MDTTAPVVLYVYTARLVHEPANCTWRNLLTR